MARHSHWKQLPFYLPLMLCALILAPIQAQIPTKTPPTPVSAAARPPVDTLKIQSNWHKAVDRGQLNVGMLYNKVPFGWLDIRGNVTGYDADILRSIVDLWGLDIQFVQVTRHTGVELLLHGEVDLLAGGQSLLVDKLESVSFSYPYHLDSIQILVRTDAPWQTPSDLIGQSIGVTQATSTQDFLGEWSQRNNIAFQIHPIATLDLGLEALLTGGIQALVGVRSELELLQREPGQIRPLEDNIGTIPLAFALPKTDSILRDAMNHALQALATNGRLRELHTLYFPSIPHDGELIPQWNDLNDEGSFQLPETITYPEHFAIPRVRDSGVLHVILARKVNSLVENLSSDVAFALSELWGLTLVSKILDENSAIEAIQKGEADIVIGIEPNWENSSRVDFTTPYLRGGSLLLTRQADDYGQISDLPSPATIAMPVEDPTISAQLRSLLDTVEIDLGEARVVSAALLLNELLTDENVDAIYASGQHLIPQLEQRFDSLRFTANPIGDKWFSRSYLSIATPENDVSFRNLIELGLQELVQSGKMTELLGPVTNSNLPEMRHRILPWPGLHDTFESINRED